MIYPVVAGLAAAGMPVAVGCRVLGVSRAGFHEWRRREPSPRAVADEALPESGAGGSSSPEAEQAVDLRRAVPITHEG